MNYYEHHLGDYAAATGHLSLIEDAVYTRMIRRYYVQEAPLPADVGQVARLVGAREPEAVAAVEAVLAEFFTLSPDGWHNKRCDEEIAKFREKIAAASRAGRASANARAAISNARSTPVGHPLNDCATHQSPDTSLQTPVSQKQEQKRASPSAQPAKGTRLPPGWSPSPELARWVAENHPAIDADAQLGAFRDYWTAKPGKDGRKLDWDATFRNWVRNSRQNARAGPAATPKTVSAYHAIGATIDAIAAADMVRNQNRIRGPVPDPDGAGGTAGDRPDGRRDLAVDR